MTTTIITTSAGPLCVSHPDSWRSRADHSDDGIFIRLSPPMDKLEAMATTILVSAIKKAVPMELFLHEIVMHLRAQRGISDLLIEFKQGSQTANVTYKLAVSDTGAPGEGDLRGIVVIHEYSLAFTRFDFVAPEAYYKAHYKEAIIMSSAVGYTE